MNPTLLKIENNLILNLAWAKSTTESNGLCNLGDSLSPIILSSLLDIPILHKNFNEPSSSAIVSVGSIGHEIKLDYAVFWGVGIEGKKFTNNKNYKLNFNPHSAYYRVIALRGPISALNFFGKNENNLIYFDPIMLLPRLLPKNLFLIKSKKKVTIIPHLSEVECTLEPILKYKFYESLLKLSSISIINTWCKPYYFDILSKIKNIISSEIILSKSFHGLLIGICYGIKSALIHHDENINSPELRFNDLRYEKQIDWRIRDFFLGQKIFCIPIIYVNLNNELPNSNYFFNLINFIPKIKIELNDDAINCLYSFFNLEKPTLIKLSKHIDKIDF